MIYNIVPPCLGWGARNGDLIAVCNIIEYLRRTENDKDLKFHMTPGAVNSAEYVQKFYEYLLQTTDYFSTEKGEADVPWKNVNIWDFRAITGDLVTFKNTKESRNKIVIFPVLDAPYNVYRNWTTDLLQKLLRDNADKFEEKYLCLISPIQGLDLCGFEISTDFKIGRAHV